MKKYLTAGVAAVVALAGATSAAFAQAKVLDTVKARGQLLCGVSTGLAGFAQPDDKGNWTGLDVDFCRALASALFNDPKKVTFKPLSAKERFTALQSGEVDLLARNTTWTISRDSSLGLSFVGVNFYDGQGFMVKKSLGVKSAKELKGASVCVQTGTTTELNLADFFRANKTRIQDRRVREERRSRGRLRCRPLRRVHDRRLGPLCRAPAHESPDEHIVLPEIISKEPLGPVVRQGDSQWFTLVKWVHYAMLNAEELGVTQKNVDEMAGSANPEIKRLLGKEGEFGKGIGLDNDWVVQHRQERRQLR